MHSKDRTAREATDYRLKGVQVYETVKTTRKNCRHRKRRARLGTEDTKKNRNHKVPDIGRKGTGSKVSRGPLSEIQVSGELCQS